MGRYFILIIFLSSVFLSKGQILKGYNPNAEFNRLIFNENFIEKNNIKSIRAEKSYKKEGDIIRSDGSKELFAFYENGRLSSYGFVNAPNFRDTIYQLYTFANELLINERLVNSTGETAELFDYDEKGRIVRKEKIKNYMDDGGIKKTTSLADEKITYKNLSDSSWVATYYNNNGKPYKEVEEVHNSLSLLKSQKERFLIGNRILSTYYWYNEKAYLSRVSVAKNKPENTLFKYDFLGNLVRIERSKGGKAQYIREFFYSEKTGMLSSSFTRYEGSGLIRIEKYYLEFY